MKIHGAKDTYFIAASSPDGRLSAIKIGVCSRGTAKKRLSVLQVGSLLKLKILLVWQGNIERKMHRNFSDSWIRGEFYLPTPALIQLIGRLRIVSKYIQRIEKQIESQEASQQVVAAKAA